MCFHIQALNSELRNFEKGTKIKAYSILKKANVEISVLILPYAISIPMLCVLLKCCRVVNRKGRKARKGRESGVLNFCRFGQLQYE